MSTHPTATNRDLPLELRPQEVIRFLVDRVAPKMADVYEPSSCIAQTNLARKVLNHFGIPNMPTPVRVHIWNDLAFTFWQKHGWIDEETGTPYNYQGELGRFALGIAGTGSVNGDRHSWDGHLIAYLSRERMFLDMTAHQFSRPRWGIPLEPLTANIGDTWDPTDEHCVVPFSTTSGVVVAYSPLPDIDPAGWLSAPDWLDADGLIDSLAEGVIAWLEAFERGEDVDLSVTVRSSTLEALQKRMRQRGAA